MLSRRELLWGAGAGALAAGVGGRLGAPAWAEKALQLDPALPAGVREGALLEELPGKAKLIKLTHRPPNFETPLSYFDSVITPNNAFFVRYHHAVIPEIDAASWRLKIGGEAAEKPLELTLDQLKKEFEPVEVTAVCLCSGNRRGLFSPHVPGVQWGHGAMGNARWKGARLKDILNRAGLKKEALEIVIDGSDATVVDKTPDYIKSVPVWKALDENSLIAYEMNGEPLPPLNGFPARVVFPGWTGTYWIKHVSSISAIAKPYDGFWMSKGYRIPRDKFPISSRFVSQETETAVPITEMVVNSLMTNVSEGQKVPVGKPFVIKGIAWDAGYGLREVEVSVDGGQSWRPAELGKDEGRFSFRSWTYAFTPAKAGQHVIMAKASNRIGQTQTSELILNPAGYHHNVIQRLTVTASKAA